MAIVTAAAFIIKPFAEDYVHQEIRSYINSAEFNKFVDQTITEYEEKHKQKNTSTVSLRKLLADKMGVDEDEVHIEIGRFYKTNDIKLIKNEIKYYHPNTLIK